MEGDTWTRDRSQQPQQGTVEREAMILYCLAAGWSWKRAGMSHATCEKLILVPKPSLESAGTQLCPVPEGLPRCLGGSRLQSPACPTLAAHQPHSFPTLALLSGCAGKKCRARRIKVFPQINRRKKENPVPVGTRPWSRTLSHPLAARVARGPLKADLNPFLGHVTCWH